MNTIKKVQLTQWLGDESHDSEKLVDMLHELLTGKYSLDDFRADVSAYDVDDDTTDDEPEEIGLIEPTNEILIGSDVIAPEPNADDMWNFGNWIGTVRSIRPDFDDELYAEVEDMDGDIFCINLNRLKLADSEI